MKRLMAIAFSAFALLGADGRDTAIYNGRLTSPMNANGMAITNAPAPTNPHDLVNKQYVDEKSTDTNTVQDIIVKNVNDKYLASYAQLQGKLDLPAPTTGTNFFPISIGGGKAKWVWFEGGGGGGSLGKVTQVQDESGTWHNVHAVTDPVTGEKSLYINPLPAEHEEMTVQQEMQLRTDADYILYTNAVAETDARIAGDFDLQSQINAISSLGRFVSTWNAKTGLPSTNPKVNPFVYEPGDYYIVGAADETVAPTNFVPFSDKYWKDVASTNMASDAVYVNDVYRFTSDKTWVHVTNKGAAVLWSQIVGNPLDNTNLVAATYYITTNTVTRKYVEDLGIQSCDTNKVNDLIGLYDTTNLVNKYTKRHGDSYWGDLDFVPEASIEFIEPYKPGKGNIIKIWVPESGAGRKIHIRGPRGESTLDPDGSKIATAATAFMHNAPKYVAGEYKIGDWVTHYATLYVCKETHFSTLFDPTKWTVVNTANMFFSTNNVALVRDVRPAEEGDTKLATIGNTDIFAPIVGTNDVSAIVSTYDATNITPRINKRIENPEETVPAGYSLVRGTTNLTDWVLLPSTNIVGYLGYIRDVSNNAYRVIAEKNPEGSIVAAIEQTPTPMPIITIDEERDARIAGDLAATNYANAVSYSATNYTDIATNALNVAITNEAAIRYIADTNLQHNIESEYTRAYLAEGRICAATNTLNRMALTNALDIAAVSNRVESFAGDIANATNMAFYASNRIEVVAKDLNVVSNNLNVVSNMVNTKQDALPTVILDYYLHANHVTGELEWKGISGGDISNYNALANKPIINGTVVTGGVNLASADLGLMSNLVFTAAENGKVLGVTNNALGWVTGGGGGGGGSGNLVSYIRDETNAAYRILATRNVYGEITPKVSQTPEHIEVITIEDEYNRAKSSEAVLGTNIVTASTASTNYTDATTTALNTAIRADMQTKIDVNPSVAEKILKNNGTSLYWGDAGGLSGTVGDANNPVYLNNGTITQGNKYAGGSRVLVNGTYQSDPTIYPPTERAEAYKVFIGTGAYTNPGWQTIKRWYIHHITMFDSSYVLMHIEFVNDSETPINSHYLMAQELYKQGHREWYMSKMSIGVANGSPIYFGMFSPDGSTLYLYKTTEGGQGYWVVTSWNSYHDIVQKISPFEYY